MLKLVEVANYLTNQLNSIGEIHEPAYTFNIQAEIGANKNAADVQGLLKSAKAKLPPVLAGRNATYNLLVELSVVAPTSNFNLKNIEEIVNTFASQVNGQEIEFSQGKGLITMTLGQAGSFKTEVGQGNIVPLSYDVVINYTEGIATSRSKHWFLDGVEIPYLKEGVYITKEGRTNKINGKKYSETFALGQQKRYRFVLPYDETSVICQTLQKDILDGDGNKTYVLTYYDNVYYTENAPFETTVMLFENADSESSKPEIAQFTITFADADDGNHTTKYYLALIDNPFDEETENTKCFEDTIVNGEVIKTAYENQIDYYEDLIDESGVPENEIPACNLSSVYLTNQTYVNTQKTDLFKIVNKNYARIRVETIENGQPKEYYFYYWTKNVQIGMDGQVTFDLKQDTVQTFLFMDEIQFEGNFIERACLNRWIENGDGTISFDGKVTSKLFERENLTNVAKRLVSREKMKLIVDSSSNKSKFNYAVQEVSCWCYIYLSAGNDYKGLHANNIELKNFEFCDGRIDHGWSSTQSIQGESALLCFPIDTYKTWYVEDSSTIDYKISAEAFRNYLEKNGGFSKIHSVKLSVKPPFPYTNYTSKDFQTIATYGSILKVNSTASNDVLDYTSVGTPSDNYALQGVVRFINFGIGSDNGYLINVLQDTSTPIQLLRTSGPRKQFEKNEIVGKLKNKIFNPKLNNSDYKEARINFIGSSETYDIQKLNGGTRFEYYEPLTSDTTKGLVQYKSNSNNEVYSLAYSESYNGLAYTNNLSLPIVNDQWDTYLAQNKNFYQAFQLQQERQRTASAWNIGANMIGGAASLAAGFATGGVSKALTAVGSAMSSSGNGEGANSGGIISSIFNHFKILKDQEFQVKQRDLTVDDMKSAPDVIQNVNGSSLLAISISPLGFYFEIYEALPHELEMANDDMFMNGFSYNLQDDVFPYINGKNDVTKKNVRKNFNYLKALIGNISGVTISNEARNDLRQRLSNGVRFWHIDNIDYEHENYERWLEA